MGFLAKVWGSLYEYSPQEFLSLVVQSLSHVQLFVTPWTAVHQASLSLTISLIKSFLQYHSLKASIIWHSDFFMVQHSHPCMITEEILKPKEIKTDTVSIFPHLCAMKWWDWILLSSFFKCWVSSQLFSLLFHLHQEALQFLFAFCQ